MFLWFWPLFVQGLQQSNGLFTLPGTDSGTDLDLVSKPDSYIVLCRSCSHCMNRYLDLYPDSDPQSLLHPFLPSANEVWGKVMFLHLSVILFGGGVYPSMNGAGGSCPGGCLPPPPTPTQTAFEAGGTHPTGMHSCWDKYPYPDRIQSPYPAL